MTRADDPPLSRAIAELADAWGLDLYAEPDDDEVVELAVNRQEALRRLHAEPDDDQPSWRRAA